MTFSSLLVQLLNGLSGASTLFLIAVGLSLIFGVTRIVNFAHGSLYMLGAYLSWSLIERFGNSPLGFWGGIFLAVVLTGMIGALIEITLLRRIYKAPELFQLLGTFAVTLIIRDAVLKFWGPEDLLGPRAPGLRGSVEILGRAFPLYDLFLIAVGPAVLGLLWLLMTRTRFGLLVRAATQDRDMVAALGVNQSVLFTSVFALGAALAALGGALQLPRETANLNLDLSAIGDAFVVVVVGGMGSIPGAFLAALIIAEIKALCIAIGTVTIGGIAVNISKFTLVAEFVVMAIVLIVRPWGLLGKPAAPARFVADHEEPLKLFSSTQRLALLAGFILLIALPILTSQKPYTTVLAIDMLIAVMFAASLHMIMGPAGMHSFGHAAYFGLGAYGAGFALKHLGLPMEMAIPVGILLAGAGAALCGWFSVRLSGVYLAMLTLAFAQIVWSVIFQWDDVTGGSNGLVGLWPSSLFSSKAAYYWLALTCTAISLFLIRRILFSPLGYAIRAARDSMLRAEAIGIDVKRVQWIAFIIAGLIGGLAGAIFAFSKGSISPDTVSVARSVDGLVMVLLGGVQSLIGPVLGSTLFTWLQDIVMRETDYWRAAVGCVILAIVLLFPRGLAGALQWLTSLMQRGARA